MHIQAAQASKKKVRLSKCTVRLYKKYSTNGIAKMVSNNAKTSEKSRVMHIGNDGTKEKIERYRNDTKRRKEKKINNESNKKAHNKRYKHKKDIRVKSTYKPIRLHVLTRYTSKPVLVRKKGTVSTECKQSEMCTQPVSNTRETSDECWKMYSIVCSVVKIRQNGAPKYKRKESYPQIILIRFSYVVWVWPKVPKSTVKGRLANVMHSVEQWFLVSLDLGNGHAPRGKNIYRGQPRVVRVSKVVKVILQRAGTISVEKMNQAGKGGRGGTMDVDGLLAGGSQGKNISIVNNMNNKPNHVISLLFLLSFYAYACSVKYKPLVLLIRHNHVSIEAYKYRNVSLYIYVRLKPYKYRGINLISHVWNMYITNTAIVSQNRMYKTVVQAFIEWGGRYGE